MFRRLREYDPRQQVILMAGFGYDSNHTIVKARQMGLQSVIYKPFRREQLLKALELQRCHGHIGHVEPAQNLFRRPGIVVGRAADQRETGQRDHRIDLRAALVEEVFFDRRT